MNKEYLLKKARQHENNAKMHDYRSYLAGWHEGNAHACYELLKSMMEWEEYQDFIKS